MKKLRSEKGEHPALEALPQSFKATMKVISGKWKVVILWHLCSGPKRYNELHRLLPEVTQHMLTKQLRELESDWIIERRVFEENPPRVEYAISPHGESLHGLFESIEKWGAFHLAQNFNLSK